ncbi:DUF4249 family protein [Aquimarina macrocephali]|uniref:DUF4249 family protein n=1 Tax=Aquimarina macrocephali TaxID=666563 RepID=UPI003F66D0E3
MKPLYRIILIIFSFLPIVSCLDEIKPDAEFEPQVFIYGYLINNTDHIKITIQKTVPVYNTNLDPVNDASVSLFTQDTFGTIALLTDDFIVNNGVYESAEMITGLVGNKYWIKVVLQDGTTYESEHEQLKIPVRITNIERINGFSRVGFRDPDNISNFYLVGYRFYNDSELIATHFELSSDNLFDGNENAFIETEYIDGNGIGISLQNLNFLTYQYYVTSFEQYENQVDFGNPETTDPFLIFSKPPVNLIGNIRNTTANETALGFFGVFSVDYREAIFN